jgi:chromosome segregation ATPase
MTRRTIGLISIILVLVIGLGALIAVPAVRADATAPLSAADKVALDARRATLKTLGQQIREAAKTVQERVKAAKAAGKDLTALKADIAAALKSGRHLRLDVARMRKPQLTEAQRTQLKTAQMAIETQRKNLQARTKAGARQAELDALKAGIKAAVQAREALMKSFRLPGQALVIQRLDNLITEATKELTALQGLLSRLP